MKVSPLDLRQLRFRTAMRGYDKAEVAALLAEVADDYEFALREVDNLRQEVTKMEALLAQHREHERDLRNTMITAQKLSDDIKAKSEVKFEDWTKVSLSGVRYLNRNVLPGAPIWKRAIRMAKVGLQLKRNNAELIGARCERGAEIRADVLLSDHGGARQHGRARSRPRAPRPA